MWLTLIYLLERNAWKKSDCAHKLKFRLMQSYFFRLGIHKLCVYFVTNCPKYSVCKFESPIYVFIWTQFFIVILCIRHVSDLIPNSIAFLCSIYVLTTKKSIVSVCICAYMCKETEAPTEFLTVATFATLNFYTTCISLNLIILFLSVTLCVDVCVSRFSCCSFAFWRARYVVTAKKKSQQNTRSEKW